MFVRNIESTWGNATQTNLLDKLVFHMRYPTGGMTARSPNCSETV